MNELVDPISVAPGLVGYVAVFGLTSLVCLMSCLPARRVENPEVRVGLFGLLVTSGLWAASSVGYLLVPTAAGKTATYTVGIIVGFATVGWWLYFASAYTGRSYHRRTDVRQIAVAIFLVVTVVKLTNPLHGLYFSTEFVETPFGHLAIDQHALHWISMGIAYSLATVGFFMLFELFVETGRRATPIAILATLTGLPVVGNVLAPFDPRLIEFSHEPIGVAAFAVGILFVYDERFLTVGLTADVEEPTIVLDEDGTVIEYGGGAKSLFPDLENGFDTPLETAVPELAAAIGDDDPIVTVSQDGEYRHYHVSGNSRPLTRPGIGSVLSLSDVTDRERYRRELERQNERLEKVAGVISHDLRNPLTVAAGHLETARGERDDDHLRYAAEALERMEALIGDVLELASSGRTIGSVEHVRLSRLVDRCWRSVDTDGATLEVDDDLEFEADPDRLAQLLENLFRNAVEHGATSRSEPTGSEDAVEHGGRAVTIRVGTAEDGFYVEDDGPGIPEDDREDVLELGYTTTDEGTGYGLAIVKEVASAHGWEVRVTDGTAGGARFEVTGIAPVRGSETSGVSM